MSILVYRDKATASAAAATMLSACIIEKPSSVLGLDYAPELMPIYRTVARMTSDGLLDWGDVRVFNLYEHVKSDAGVSMNAQLGGALLDKVNICTENRFLPNTESRDWSVACNDYESEILGVGGLDTVFCAIRADGSIAYNQGESELAPVTHVERTDAGRVVTVGITTIMSAKRIIAVMIGPDKAEMAGRVFNGSIVPSVPASYLQLHANAIFLLDEDAAEMM